MRPLEGASAPPKGLLRLVKVVKTRWWSVYKALYRIYQLRTPLSRFCDIPEGSDFPVLQPGDWDGIASLLEVMGPVATWGFRLEAAQISSPYLLRVVVSLYKRLQEPAAKAPLYSGRAVSVAAADKHG